MIETPVLLFDLGFVILAGTVFAFLAKILKQPVIVGYIVAGIVLGPIGFQLIRDYANIGVLSELGIAFLLFAIGMQIDFSKLWKFKKTIILGGLAQIGITACVVAIIMQFFGSGFIESVYIGFIMAFSSTAIVVKILSDARRLNSLEAKLVIGYALVQDIVAVIVLPLLANPETILRFNMLGFFLFGIFALFALAFVFSKKIFPKIMEFSAKSSELFYLATISSCFLFMFIANSLGFSIAVGAFIGGLALAKVSFSSEALSRIEHIRDLFATVFFVSLGLQLSLSFFSPQSLVFFPIMLAIVFILNPVILYFITLYSGFGKKIAWFVGLSLAQASEFSFILARQGFSGGQISEALYNTAIWVILISMIATPYLINSSEKVSGFFQKLFRNIEKRNPFYERKLKKFTELPSAGELKNHIVIAGGGVFGSGIANALRDSAKIIVVDHDPEVLETLNSKKISAVYASKTNDEIWEKICLENAKAFVITMPDANLAIKLVKKAKKMNPRLAVFARAHYFKDALELYNAKADFVVMPVVLGGNTCLEAIQNYLETGKIQEPALREEFMRVLKEKAEEEQQQH
ncbi:MAG: cation:proton antiporter [Candidatus ainarchaeum sp.]|nr:cation:proton antiporter [Candidatus ainarchaeum sp.]